SLSIICSTDSPPTHIPTLPLHDALPIFRTPYSVSFGARRKRYPNRRRYTCERHMHDMANRLTGLSGSERITPPARRFGRVRRARDRKSTRLNSSHVKISYAVFCLKKKID